MNLMPLPLPGAELALETDWLPPADADALLAILQTAIPWEVHRIRLFGRELASPRLSCWIGAAGAAHAFSGAVFHPRPWPASLLPVRPRLRAAPGPPFTTVL